MQNTLAQVLATVIILVKLRTILRMSTAFILLNDPILRQAKDGQLYTQPEFHSYYGSEIGELHWQAAQPVPDSPLEVQRNSAHGGTATEHQTAQPELDVFTHVRTDSAHQSPATEHAAADDHRIAETSASNNITIGIWQVQFPKHWSEYESELQSIIEQQYQNGVEIVRFRQCRSPKKDIWYDYNISFRSMEQCNEKSGRVRRVRRIERNVLALDMATAEDS